MKKLAVLLTVIVMYGRSECWDLAVAVDDKIELIDLRGNKTYITNEEFKNLQGIAYNQHDEIYVVERRAKDSYIFSYQLHRPVQEAKNIIIEPSTKIKSLAYDNIDNALYWTTGEKGAIMWYRSTWLNASGKVLHQFQNVSLHGITIDICGRYLYWTNNAYKSSTIERSRLGNFSREILINKDLFNPLGIAVDWQTHKLFWCDDTEGSSFQIERSNLDGTAREVLYRGHHDEPRAMTIAQGRLFWTENANNRLLSLRTTDRAGLSPLTIKHWGPGLFLMGVTSRISSCDTDHAPTEILKWATTTTEDTATDTIVDPAPGRPNITPYFMEQEGSTYCLNSGRISGNHGNSVPKCECPEGFSGARCELPLCHNFCVHGTCVEEEPNVPKCRCLRGYGGDRCEIDYCEGHCLNGGTCDWNDTSKFATCHCPEGRFGGTRCTEDLLLLREYCHMQCHQQVVVIALEGLEDLYHCDCSEAYTADKNSSFLDPVIAAPHEPQTAALLIACVALGCSVLALLIFLGVALRRMAFLSKQPRLRKRIIVNKKARQQELPDRRPSGQSSGEQCEITIENCCNMNICETPCYEPQIRPGKSKTKDEKKTLLGSMEGESPAASSENSLY